MLMMTLCACGKSGAADDIRGFYSGMTSAALDMTLTADYGDNIITYGIKQTYTNGDNTLLLYYPEELAGLSVTQREGKTEFEYDDNTVDAGTLAEAGISPVCVLPSIVSQWKDGIVTETGEDKIDGTLYITAQYGAKLKEIELFYRTWFFCDTFLPMKTEVFCENKKIMLCEYKTAKIE